MNTLISFYLGGFIVYFIEYMINTNQHSLRYQICTVVAALLWPFAIIRIIYWFYTEEE